MRQEKYKNVRHTNPCDANEQICGVSPRHLEFVLARKGKRSSTKNTIDVCSPHVKVQANGRKLSCHALTNTNTNTKKKCKRQIGGKWQASHPTAWRSTAADRRPNGWTRAPQGVRRQTGTPAAPEDSGQQGARGGAAARRLMPRPSLPSRGWRDDGEEKGHQRAKPTGHGGWLTYGELCRAAGKCPSRKGHPWGIWNRGFF